MPSNLPMPLKQSQMHENLTQILWQPPMGHSSKMTSHTGRGEGYSRGHDHFAQLGCPMDLPCIWSTGGIPVPGQLHTSSTIVRKFTAAPQLQEGQRRAKKKCARSQLCTSKPVPHTLLNQKFIFGSSAPAALLVLFWC